LVFFCPAGTFGIRQHYQHPDAWHEAYQGDCDEEIYTRIRAEAKEVIKSRAQILSISCNAGISHLREYPMGNVRRRTTTVLHGGTARYAKFGSPPLLEDEDEAAYDEILATISAVVKPTDCIEEMLVRDIVDHAWEALRLRRIKAQLLPSALQSLEDTSFFGLEVFDKTLQNVERLNRVCISIEVRRDSILREIERRRDRGGGNAGQIDDAQYSVLPSRSRGE
jgi:hypothetical protein